LFFVLKLVNNIQSAQVQTKWVVASQGGSFFINKTIFKTWWLLVMEEQLAQYISNKLKRMVVPR
jgi:hypothetical protein